MDNKVYTVPGDIDRYVATVKLKSLGAGLDVLTAEQKKYINSYEG